MAQATQKNLYSAGALLVASLLIIGATFFIAPRPVLSQATPTSIAGYAWSDNIGWIDLNCSNSGVCGTNPFGLSINASGGISGYVWSDSVGWISANSSDLTGCPSGPCTATLAGGALSGWLKALSADNKGWDGWISLSGSGYGPTVTNGLFSGYAWGSDVVGWVSFANAYTPCSVPTTYTCTGTGNQTITQNVTATNCQVTNTNLATCVSPQFCTTGSAICLFPSPEVVPNGNQTGNLTARPSLIPFGRNIKVYWDIAYVQSCTVTGTDGDSWTGLTSGLTGTTSSAIKQQTVYTLSCLQDDGVTHFTQTATVNVAPTYQER
jgi:hypothetical protein